MRFILIFTTLAVVLIIGSAVALEPSYGQQLTVGQNTINQLVIWFVVGFIVLSLIFVWVLRNAQRREVQKLKAEAEENMRQVNIAYQKLKDSQDQLIQSEKMSALSQMVAGISHELNTPLSYVTSNLTIVRSSFNTLIDIIESVDAAYCESVKPKKDNDKINKAIIDLFNQYKPWVKDNDFYEAKELLDDSYHGLADIDDIIQHLRTFSRLDHQVIERFNICESLNNTLKITNSLLRQHNIEVVKHYTQEPILEGNPSKLNQVFLNIINNAVQAMSGSDDGRLTITVKTLAHAAEISFQDTGKGMDSVTRSKVFDPFFTTKPVGEGTGLGMSISYKIVKEHKGQIEIKSDINQGTTVLLRLPLKIAA